MVELLAPAGSMEALEAAINAGADAVYVGGSRFNARAYAANFDTEALKLAVKLCHLHGVRLFVTVNILYKEDEIAELYDYLKDLYEMQVDALIVQDEGLMRLILSHFPNFEIHASTQCSVHNPQGVLHYQKLGVKRVVAARENSLEELKEMINQTDTEIEAFVHGALCVSYSGQCYMSQMIGKRSANRGQCAQPCRLNYQLLFNQKPLGKPAALLSCKDLCTIEHISELVAAGIVSFKIEGRMKRPAYVYEVTKAYRDAIDGCLQPHCEDKLRQIFNRDFTSGYLFSEKQIASPEYAGNRGIVLGEVVAYHKKTKRLMIKSCIDVCQGDGIRIGYSDDGKVLNKIYMDGKLVNKVPAGKTFETDFLTAFNPGTRVYRTTSFLLEKEINKSLHQLQRRVPIEMILSGSVGKAASLTVKDGQHEITVIGTAPIEKALQKADNQRLKEQLGKLGNTIYTAEKTVLSIQEDCFIPIKQINELRRLACEKLDRCRENQPVRLNREVLPLSKEHPKTKKLYKTYYHFHTLKQLNAALPKKADEVFFFDLTSEFEKAKAAVKEIGLVIPTIADQDVFAKCDALLLAYPDLRVACGNVGAYERYKEKTDLLLPAMNLSHLLALDSYDVPAVVSPELDEAEIKQLENQNACFVAFTYGHLDNMTTKHCPVSCFYHGQKVTGCNACKKGKYSLLDRANARFDLMFDDHCIVHILSEKPLQRKRHESSYLRFTSEDPATVQKIIRTQRK